MDDGKPVFPEDGSAAKVVLEFPSFRDFIEAYSPIISERGIFIRNQDVSASNAFSVGDRIGFEVRLKDDFRLIQGAGEVVWLGNFEAADTMGTAVRFSQIDEPSQRLITRLVGNYERDGGKLFDIDALGAGAAPAEAVVATEDSGAAEGPATSELTAETLGASEADVLFAAEPEEAAPAPLEFESVSAAEAGVGEPPATELSLDDPVGLETIAIPAGLVSEMSKLQSGADDPGSPGSTSSTSSGGAPEGQDESPTDAALDLNEQEPLLEPVGDLEAPVASVEAVDNLTAEPPAAVPPDTPTEPDMFSVPPPASMFDALEAVEASGKPSDPEVEVPAVEADTPTGIEAPVAEVAEAAVESLDTGASPAVISDEIAQVAEELSGVHRVEMPDEETSGATYAGAASASSESNTGGRVAALVVIASLLGAAAYYFGDTLKEWVGLGDDDVAVADLRPVNPVRPGNTDEPSTTPTEQDQDGAPSAAGEEPEALEAEGEAGAVAASRDEPDQEAGENAIEPPPSASAEPPAAPGREAARQKAEAPVPAAAPPASAEPSRSAASADSGTRRVERISWDDNGATTVVTIRLNTEVSQAYFEVVRVRQGAPRDVLKIQGVEAPYSPSQLTVGSNHVARLRTGLHSGADGSALHVVADLTGPSVKILSVVPSGRDLVVTFSS